MNPELATKREIPRTAVTALHRTLERHLLKHSDFAEPSGSYRRGDKTVGDVDYLLGNADMPSLVDHLVTTGKKENAPFKVHEVVRNGPKHASLHMEHKGRHMDVDFYSVPSASRGAGHLHLTGPAEFNHMLRSYAKNKGMLLNQYGLHDRETGKKLAGRTEKAIFQKLGLREIPPHLRSDKFFDTKDQFAIRKRGLKKEVSSLLMVLANVAVRLRGNNGAAKAPGTYISVYPDGDKLRQIMSALLKGVNIDDNLHCTLVYAPDNPITKEIGSYTNPRGRFQAVGTKLAWWPGSDNEGYLVLQLKSLELQHRHKFWEKTFGLKHTFSTFKPHITLATPIKQTPQLESVMDSVNDYLAKHPLTVPLTGETVDPLKE